MVDFDKRFNSDGQDLPDVVQKMLDSSPVTGPNDPKNTEGYIIHVTPSELFDMEKLQEKWDTLTTEEALEHIERILDKARVRVFAKALLERKAIRLTANEDPRKAQLSRLHKRRLKEKSKRKRRHT